MSEPLSPAYAVTEEAELYEVYCPNCGSTKGLTAYHEDDEACLRCEACHEFTDEKEVAEVQDAFRDRAESEYHRDAAREYDPCV